MDLDGVLPPWVMKQTSDPMFKTRPGLPNHLDFAHLQSPPVPLFTGRPSIDSIDPSAITTRGGQQVCARGTNLCNGVEKVDVFVFGRRQDVIRSLPNEVTFFTCEQWKSGRAICQIESLVGSSQCAVEVDPPVIRGVSNISTPAQTGLIPGETWILYGDNFGNDATKLRVTFWYRGEFSFPADHNKLSLQENHSKLSFVVPNGYGDGVWLYIHKLEAEGSSVPYTETFNFAPVKVGSATRTATGSLVLNGGPFLPGAVVSVGLTNNLASTLGNNGRELHVTVPGTITGQELPIKVTLPGLYSVDVSPTATFSSSTQARPITYTRPRGSSLFRPPQKRKAEYRNRP